MKGLTKLFLFGGAIAATIVGIPAALADAVTDPVSTDQFLGAIFMAIGGMKGAGTLAIVAAVVQLVMMFFRTSLADFAGKWKLMIVLVLNLVLSVIALMAQGMSFGAALLHGSVLAAAQVLVNQVWKQFVTKQE